MSIETPSVSTTAAPRPSFASRLLTWPQLADLGLATGHTSALTVRVEDGHGHSATAQTTVTVAKAHATVTLGGDREAYRYLPRSLRPFPDPERLAMILREAGFGGVTYERLTLGIAAIHVAQV